jgi:hypothetical protein
MRSNSSNGSCAAWVLVSLSDGGNGESPAILSGWN